VTRDSIRKVLERAASGELSVDAALEELKAAPFRDLGFARVDSHREVRCGVPEVVFAPGKTAEQIVAIAQALIAEGHGVLVTRLDAAQAATLCRAIDGFTHNALARTARRDGAGARATKIGRVAVVSAGTADQAVAEEATETLAFLGVEYVRVRDVGVAGIQRLLASRDDIVRGDVVIVVAGMEGALPSVVGGLVDIPVIAVPTSVGYGASFDGLAALLAMMNSCAAGVTVVNIDNGFGAAVAAALILRTAARAAERA
jgi:NCAIR mutase (PurE)-related protein